MVEAAAVRTGADGAQQELAAVAHPGKVSPAALQFAGLAPAAVAGKPEPRTVLRRVLKFSGAGLVVVYDADAFNAFVEAEGMAAPACLDARRLAQIALPQAADYTAAGIAAELGIELPAGRRALDRARLTAGIWQALLEELGKLPSAARHLVCRLAEAAIDPLAPVLADIAHSGELALTSDPETALRDLFPEQSDLLRRVQKSEQAEPADNAIPSDGIVYQLYGSWLSDGQWDSCVWKYDHPSKRKDRKDLWYLFRIGVVKVDRGLSALIVD